MIGRWLKKRLSVKAMLKGLPEFVIAWIRSRSVRLLLLGIPATAILIIVLIATAIGTSDHYAQKQRQRYERLADEALIAGDKAASQLYFRRLLNHSESPDNTAFEYAKRIYAQSNACSDHSVLPYEVQLGVPSAQPDSLGQRALTIMHSLAPKSFVPNGLPDAHDFLVEFWTSRRPQNDATQLLTLQHGAFGHPEDSSATIRLARFMFEKNYRTQAISILKRHPTAPPEIEMAIALYQSRSGLASEAQKSLQRAEATSRRMLQKRPEDTETISNLAKALGAQGRVLESLLVLADGCSLTQDPGLIDRLIRHYTIWLATIAPERLTHQLNEIQFALAPDFENDSDPLTTTADLVLSSGETVTLPQVIVHFHEALMEGNGDWLGPMLTGTDQAVSGNLPAALEQLTLASEIKPEHPVIQNNLAWCLLKLHEGAETDEISDHEVSTKTEPQGDGALQLEKAWDLADRCVSEFPDRLVFRETRGRIAAKTNRWDVAVEDLKRCTKSGEFSSELFTLLENAETQASKL